VGRSPRNSAAIAPAPSSAAARSRSYFVRLSNGAFSSESKNMAGCASQHQPEEEDVKSACGNRMSTLESPDRAHMDGSVDDGPVAQPPVAARHVTVGERTRGAWAFETTPRRFKEHRARSHARHPISDPLFDPLSGDKYEPRRLEPRRSASTDVRVLRSGERRRPLATNA